MATQGLTADQLEAWILLNAFLETVPSAIDAQLKNDAGINLFEYTVLAMMSEQPDQTIAMSRLADVSFGSISRLSHAVGRLEKRGWVEKRAGEGGRRHNTVSLTDEGFAALRSVAGHHIANVRRLLVEPLTSDELDALRSALRKMIGAADDEVASLLDVQIPDVIARNQSATPFTSD